MDRREHLSVTHTVVITQCTHIWIDLGDVEERKEYSDSDSVDKRRGKERKGVHVFVVMWDGFEINLKISVVCDLEYMSQRGEDIW